MLKLFPILAKYPGGNTMLMKYIYYFQSPLAKCNSILEFAK